MLSNLEKQRKEIFTWSNGELIKGKVQIYSDNYALHYSGICIWEGIRSYKSFTKKKTNIVGLWDHLERLQDSAKIVGMRLPYTVSELYEACKKVVRSNGGGDLYLRPVAYATKSAERVTPEGTGVSVDIYAFEVPKLSKSGRKVGFSSSPRGYPQYQMQAKASMNYPHLQLCEGEMKQRGWDDVLMLDNDGYITEGLVTNIFIVKSGYLLTPPNNGSILPGITRKNVYNIFSCSDFRVKLLEDKQGVRFPSLVLEKRLTRADILTADEIFACGTYSEIVPIVEVEGRIIGDGKPGRFTAFLQKAYEDSVRDKVRYGVTLDEA